MILRNFPDSIELENRNHKLRNFDYGIFILDQRLQVNNRSVFNGIENHGFGLKIWFNGLPGFHGRWIVGVMELTERQLSANWHNRSPDERMQSHNPAFDLAVNLCPTSVRFWQKDGLEGGWKTLPKGDVQCWGKK